MNIIFATKEDAAKLGKKLVRRVSKAEDTLIFWSFVFLLTLIIFMIVVFKINEISFPKDFIPYNVL